MIKYFQVHENGSTLKTEIMAGITTFLATAYIIIVNPIILSRAGMPFSGLVTATILVAFFSSVAMGLYAKNPIVVAPGMGINAFFTFTLVLGMGVPWATALGAVFWSGIVFLLLSIFNIRTKIVAAIPASLQKAIACGIGLFIALIGLSNGGLIQASSATMITSAPLSPKVITFMIGLLVTAYLVIRKVQGGLFYGIILTSLMTIPLGRLWGQDILISYKGLYAPPDFSLLFSLDIAGSLKWTFVPVIFSMLFTDLFDSLSTFVGVAQAGNLLASDGRPRNIKQSLIVDGFSTALSGLLGSSSGTSFIESAAGISQGGRTGLVAVVAGLLFLPFLFLSPLLSVIPALATAPVLVIVGAFMMKPIVAINWNDLEEAFPAFLGMILIPLSYSITHGIIWGFLSYAAIKIMRGKIKEVPPFLHIINILAVLALVLK